MKILRKKQQDGRRRSDRNARGEGRTTSAALEERYSFRRNRTLTGSLASHVASANEEASELRSPRVKTHDLRRQRRRVFLRLVAVIGAGILLGYGIYQSIAIVRIVSSGHIAVSDPGRYESKIQEYLGGHFFERSRVTVDLGRLTAYVQDNGCPEVASISNPKIGGLGATTFEVTFRKPVVSWKTGVNQLFVDSEGNAFERNLYPAPAVEVVDQTGIPATNRVLASNRFLGFIGRVIGQMEVQGYKVTQVVLPADTTRQILISLEGVAYPVKLSTDRPAGEQAEDAARAIHHLANNGIGAEYIDIRVSGKAYYK